MSSENHPTRAARMYAGVRNAKKKALNNAVWLPPKMRAKWQQHDIASSQHDIASSQCDTASSQRDKASSQRDKASSQRDKASSQRDKASSQRDTVSSAEGEPQWGSHPRSKPKPMKSQSRYVSPVAEEDEVEIQRQSPNSDSEQLEEPRWGSQPRTKSKPNKKHRYISPATSEDEAKAVKYKRPRLYTKKSSGHHTRTHQLKSIKEDQSVEQSESEEADDDGNRTNFDGTDSSLSDFEDPKSIAKTLSTEIPSFVSSIKAKNQAVTVDKQSARARKRATETPMWADDLLSESEESRDEPAPKSDLDTSIFVKSEQDSSDAERMGSESSSHHSGSSNVKLILTDNGKAKNGKVKMTDQDTKTRNVIQGAILEAKAYMTFINGYPELIEKTSFSRDALLKSARDRGATSIEMEIKNNDAYASALASLGTRVPLFRGELKDDACSQVTAYFRLGSDSAASAKLLIDNHSYHYSMQFGDDNTPKPVRHKPYQGDIIVNIMKSRYFNGSKSVGVVFAHKFTEIAKNKANRPEVSIPMVALTSTSVYAALFWKAQGSPPKFNFTGNQFSEVYIFHVQFLEDLKKNAPQKFHKLMADIFAAIEALTHTTKNTGTDSKTNALAFLDLDGMDE
ncbi:hypothetical protein BD769DRAFT_1669965 [Suillus cothurnatus]|nr:hypothetical protein BD769DRAFT_1669965 [Suillus cothurnatus]